jgi:hypothetical protein
VGKILIGGMKNGPNIGVLMYSCGVLIRSISGRLPVSEENEDELHPAVQNVTAIIDVENRLTPIAGPLSDFTEAIASSNEWSQMTSKIAELCLIYSQKGTL